MRQLSLFCYCDCRYIGCPLGNKSGFSGTSATRNSSPAPPKNTQENKGFSTERKVAHGRAFFYQTILRPPDLYQRDGNPSGQLRKSVQSQQQVLLGFSLAKSSESPLIYPTILPATSFPNKTSFSGFFSKISNSSYLTASPIIKN